MALGSQHRSGIGPIPSLAVLSCSAAVAGQFIIFAVPLFLRAGGAASGAVGLMMLVAIPYVARFLWAPLLDRRGVARLGHYRGWVLGPQVVLVGLFAALATLDPVAEAMLLVALLVPVSVCLGTQVMALEALTVRLIPAPDVPRAVVWQRAGTALAGAILGGGVVWGFGGLGWAAAMLALTVVQAAALALLLAAPLDRGAPRPAVLAFHPADYVRVFRLPGIPVLFAVGALATLVCDLPYAMKSVLLVDAGFGVAEVGLIGIVLANALGLVAALAARPLVERHGGYRVMVSVAALGCGLAAVHLGLGHRTGWPVAAYTVTAGALVYAASIAMAQLLYARVDPDRAATDVAGFGTASSIVILAINAVATGMLDRVGLTAVLTVAGIASLAGAMLAARQGRT
ncbi:hypothetical protein [Rhodobacter calidifons]|uniref:MFS transporter n=1 Tax=Rhodobacter calidifons TaxID=2715277 RepID=A0ABX0G9Y3_9RHOB|nr:hypothetical protein [Rhodobacter calidifons]NHB77506.1 hypothetical protein [Rhodobacter calidifons]